MKRVALVLAASLIILLAVILGGLRLAVTNIDYFKSEIEYLLTGDEASGIVFTGLSGSMDHFDPVLRIENVSLNLPDRSQPLFINRLDVEFDFWRSLWQWRPVALEISGQLERIELVRDTSSRWWLYESEIGAGEKPLVVDEIAQALALVPRYVKLDLQRLILRDESLGRVHQVERVSAHIDNSGGQYLVQVSAALPEQLGTGLLIKSEIGRDRSVVYVNASNLQLKPVADLFGIDTWGLQSGALDGEAWFNLDGFRVAAINGDLILKQGVVQTSPERRPVEVDYHARFNALNRKQSWRISSRFERLQVDGKYVPGFGAQLDMRAAEEHRLITARIDRLEISSLPAVAAQVLPLRVNQQIQQGNLRGLLRDLALIIDLDNPRDFRATARVSGLRSAVVDNFPGFENLNADVTIAGNRMGLRLYGDNVGVDFGDLFRAPLELDRIDVSAALESADSGIVVRAERIAGYNEDIRFDGRAWFEADGRERPFMYLRTRFSDGRAGSKSKYFPARIMHEKTLEWLDRGIKGGRVPEGDMLFYGRLQDIRKLERDKSGEFRVEFRIEDGDLLFAPGWLHARNADGRIRFHNVGMEFDLDRVTYDTVDNATASGRIANFELALLELSIRAEVPTATAMRTWMNTPISEPFRPVAQRVRGFGGTTSADIALRLPLSSRPGVGDRDVRVRLDLHEAAARVPEWGLDLDQIDGSLEIGGQSISASRIGARYFGDPVVIDIETEADSGDTLIRTRGRLGLAKLLNRFPAQITDKFVGSSEWQLRLALAREHAADEPYLKINAASNLQGTEIDLPPPFARPAAEVGRLAADLSFYAEKIDFAATYGEDLRSRGHIAVIGGERAELEGLELAFAVPLKPKPTDGIKIYGKLPDLSLDQWLKQLELAGRADPSQLRLVDLQIGRVEVFDRTLEAVRLEVGQAQDRLSGTLMSSLMRGKFQFPFERSRETPILVDLEYLRIDEQERKTDLSVLRPERLDDFRFSCAELVFHDMLFNDVYVEGRRGIDAFYVDQLKMRRDEVFLNGSASWRFDPESDASSSSLEISMQGDDLGRAIAGLGFGDAMRGGKIDFDAGLTWAGPPYGFNLETLKGDARLKIEDGVLNNVDPGSGRLVGLLSLSALPRRLALDFSDVLIKGMEFDTISGTYRIDKGVLSTGNTRLEGPAARIKISGNTGILNRDYDQLIQITPKIRQTLPVIGAVSAGSTVGWGLLLLQNLFKKSIDKAVEVEYRVTGSWDDPKVELLKAVDENQQELPDIEDRK